MRFGANVWVNPKRPVRESDHNEAIEAWAHARAFHVFCMREVGTCVEIKAKREKTASKEANATSYLFWCGTCEMPAEDHIHGDGNLYVNCSNCGARQDFVPSWQMVDIILYPFALLWRTLSRAWDRFSVWHQNTKARTKKPHNWG